jgi:hypothetical protein
MYFIACLFLSFLLGVYGNVTAQSALVSYGGDVSNATGSVSVTVGQIDYLQAVGPDGAVNEGVQQPWEWFPLSTPGIDNPFPEIQLVPNPATSMVNIRFEESYPHPVKLYLKDMNGRLLFESEWQPADAAQIFLANYPNAPYLVELEIKGFPKKVFNLIKQ